MAWSFTLAPCIAWRIEDEIGRRIDASEDGEVLDLTAERARLVKVQRKRIEREIATMDGRTIATELVADEWTKQTLRMKNRLLAIPSRAAPMVLGLTDLRQVAGKLQSMIHEALDELSNETER